MGGHGNPHSDNPGPRLENLFVTGNDYEAITSFGSSYQLRNSRIIGNNGSGLGFIFTQHPIIENVIISNNTSGGVNISEYAKPHFENVDIIDNTNNGDGGGIYANNNGYPILNNCEVNGNTSQGAGGGICLDGGHISIINSSITGNAAGNSGTGNSTSSGGGGGLYIGHYWGDDYAAIISNSTIGNNYAPSGGGIKVAQRMKANGAVLLTNTQIVGNSSEGYAVTGSDCFIIFDNVTISNNTGDSGVLEFGSTAKTVFMNTIVYGNTPSTIYSGGYQDNHTFSYSNIEGGWTPQQSGQVSNENSQVNPFFINPYQENFQLQSNSPCKNTGENGVEMGAYGGTYGVWE